MPVNQFIRTTVGADLSRPPPIYRPVMPDDAHGRIAYATSSIAPWDGKGIPHVPIILLIGMIAPVEVV